MFGALGGSFSDIPWTVRPTAEAQAQQIQAQMQQRAFAEMIERYIGPPPPMPKPQNSGPNVDELKKEFYKEYQKAFNRCVWKEFNTDVDGNVVGLALYVERQTIRNAPDVDMSREFGAQGTIDANRGSRGTIRMSPSLHGWTLNSGQVVSNQEQWFRTYGHELANLIAERRFGKDAATNLLGTRQGIRGDVRGSLQTDYDIGARVEKCMFGNVSY